MPKVIIADTSCLIVLSKINELEILQKLFKQILITPEIQTEFNEPLPDWIKVENIKDKLLFQSLQLNLDKGEASAISLSLEQVDKTILIIDERKGRKFAQELGIAIIGTIGILLKAKTENIIPSVKEILQKLNATDFRVSEKMIQEILKSANEL
ncbi:MAG: hypothetical protein RL708_206 [Bacteroidota bacterium]|jgi:predicted nucleic acid-binding protein